MLCGKWFSQKILLIYFTQSKVTGIYHLPKSILEGSDDGKLQLKLCIS